MATKTLNRLAALLEQIALRMGPVSEAAAGSWRWRM